MNSKRVEARQPPRHVVVCVDDEAEVLAALGRALREEPYELLLTTRPHEAIEWLSTREVSVIIADQKMPVITGVDVLRAAEDSSPRTARILLTAYPSDPMVVKGVGEGSLLLIGKPWNDAALREAIRDHLPSARKQS
jgi:DNA-binding NtrC family response regulator